MEPPVAAEVETKSEKTNETERAKSYNCELCDTEVVYKIAQELLPGLASACVDNTTGGVFTSAGSVAVDMRKDMADYLTQRSETYVAEFLLSENANGLEISEHPYDIIVNLIDDFAAAKRNMLSRVSEWVLSDRREDRIDDFVQEMEINGFWLLARREYIASMLLKNVDYKNAFHCNLVFNTEEELTKHRSECKFRPMDCTNEGCTTRYCAAQTEHHEAVCPFMILPCEQKCSDFVMRREMDRHCVTICPMKLVNCAFYTVGCKSNIPRCDIQQHNVDNLSSHLLYILRTAHKEATDEDLKHRVEQIRNQSNTEKLAKARDARALTFLIKDSEAKLGSLDVKSKPNASESAESSSSEDDNKKESPTKTESLPAVVKDGSDSPNKKEERLESTEKPVITEDTKSPVESATTNERSADSPAKVEESKDKKDEKSESPTKKDVTSDSEEDSQVLATKESEKKESPIKGTLEEQPQKEVEETLRSSKGEKAKEQSTKSPKKETVQETNNNDKQDSKKSLEEEKIKQLSSSDEEDARKSSQDETFKESSRGDEEESTKKETFKEPSSDFEESSHQRQSTHDSFESDEESMKSPLYSETEDANEINPVR